METRVTKLLGIEYPIIQGGMAWVANANLAANVSKAESDSSVLPMHRENG